MLSDKRIYKFPRAGGVVRDLESVFLVVGWYHKLLKIPI